MSDNQPSFLDYADTIPEVDQTEGTSSPETPGDNTAELDAELTKLGFDAMPNTPREEKEKVITRFKTLQAGLTPKLQRAAALEQELAEERGKRQALEDIAKYRPEAPKSPEDADAEAQRAKAEAELFKYFDKWAATKVNPKIEYLENQWGQVEYNRLRGKHDDWQELEPQIIEAMRTYPNMDGETAYRLASAATLDSRAEKIARTMLESKKGASTVTSSSGASTPKPFDLADVRSISREDAFQAAYEAAKASHLRK